MGKEIKYDSLDYYKVLGVSPETPEEEAEKTSAEDSSSVSDSQEPSETPAP